MDSRGWKCMNYPFIIQQSVSESVQMVEDAINKPSSAANKLWTTSGGRYWVEGVEFSLSINNRMATSLSLHGGN